MTIRVSTLYDMPSILCEREECMREINGRRVNWDEEIPGDADTVEEVLQQANRHRATHNEGAA